jgi:ribonuclease R
MSERIGQTFTGTISGVAKWGVYVEEKETKCEGLVPVAKLGDDYFVFDEKTYSMVGERTGKKYTLGDSIRFKIISADLDKRELEVGVVG